MAQKAVLQKSATKLQSANILSLSDSDSKSGQTTLKLDDTESTTPKKVEPPSVFSKLCIDCNRVLQAAYHPDCAVHVGAYSRAIAELDGYKLDQPNTPKWANTAFKGKSSPEMITLAMIGLEKYLETTGLSLADLPRPGVRLKKVAPAPPAAKQTVADLANAILSLSDTERVELTTQLAQRQ